MYSTLGAQAAERETLYGHGSDLLICKELVGIANNGAPLVI
jgi:hypothetical protein